MSLKIAAMLQLGGKESYPDVFKPFGRLADGIAVEDGYVALPDNPGTGFEAKSSFYALLLTLTDDLAGGQTAT
jgi:D(-)-tartrate dehydratase